MKPSDGISLYKETSESSLAPSARYTHSKNSAVPKLPSPSHAGTPILDFSLQNCEKQASGVYQPPDRWYFVTASEKPQQTLS